MLAIRMQRTGRKGHAMFRVVVQDSRTAPSSGKVVALLGNYDPHLKTSTIAKDKAKFFLDHGAHPSERVAKLLKENDVKLPKWVQPPLKKNRTTRNPDKLAKAETPVTAPAAEPAAPAETEPEVAAEETVPIQDKPVADEAVEAAAEEPKAEPVTEVEAEKSTKAETKPTEDSAETPAEETEASK